MSFLSIEFSQANEAILSEMDAIDHCHDTDYFDSREVAVDDYEYLCRFEMDAINAY